MCVYSRFEQGNTAYFHIDKVVVSSAAEHVYFLSKLVTETTSLIHLEEEDFLFF